MARPRSTDREKLLNCAEKVIARDGAAALSFASVAEAAGLSKASVQTAFGSRESLIEALLTRWMVRESETYHALLAEDHQPSSRLRAHLRSTMQEDGDQGRTVSAMLATLASTGNASSAMKEWYRERMNGLDAEDPASRRRRLAYLAAEGVFLLRNLVGVEIDDKKWGDIFRDIDRMID